MKGTGLLARCHAEHEAGQHEGLPASDPERAACELCTPDSEYYSKAFPLSPADARIAARQERSNVFAPVPSEAWFAAHGCPS